MMKIDRQRLDEIMKDCLYRDSELPEDGSPPEDALLIEGVISKFGLHPERVQKYTEEIGKTLELLPDDFHVGSGGGQSFLNACVQKDGTQWGEHPDMEVLFVLGIAVNKVRLCMPREMWFLFPGSMPYYAVNVEGFSEDVQMEGDSP